MKKYLLLFVLLVSARQIFAQCNILPNAVAGISLVHQNTNCFNNSGVAFNPIQNLYYGVRAGNSSFPLETWTVTGIPQSNTNAGFDWRGMWWNPMLSQLEGNGYSTSGLYNANLNGAGFALNTGTVLFTGQNQPDAQSCGDLDFDANEVLYYFNGAIHRYDRTNMTFISSYPITGTPVAISNLNSTSLMYTGCLGKEIALLDYVNKNVYLYNKANGAFVGTSALPSSAVTTNTFRVSYANCHVWLFDLGSLTWFSYSIFDACATVAPCPTVNTNSSQILCNGDSLLVNGIWQFTSGIFKDTFLNSAGCDSIHTLNLTISPKPNLILNAAICQGDSFFGYQTTGTFIDTFTNAAGCDSLRTINLLVHPITTATINETICQGDNFDGYTLAGTYIDTIPSANANGCDSVRTLNLTVIPLPNVISSVSPNDTICTNASITLTGSGALNYAWSSGVQNNVAFIPSSSGIYTLTGTDNSGCSNTSTVSIFIFQNPTLSISAVPNVTQLCKGESIALSASGGLSYVWSHGQANGSSVTPLVTTTYTVVGVNNYNCTASNTKTITVRQSYRVADTVKFCEGSSVNYNGIIIQNAGVQIINLQTIFGCDSIIDLYAMQVAQPKYEDLLPNHACKGVPVELSAVNNTTSNSFAWQSSTGLLQSQNQNKATFLFNADGQQPFSVIITPPAPCTPFTILDNIDIHEVTAAIINAGNSHKVCAGDTIALVNSTNNNYQFDWQPASIFVSGGQGAQAILPASTIVTLTVSDVYNCASSDTISLELVNCCMAYVPNAFTPDNNGKNDVIMPILEDGVGLEKFIIYNQWGEVVFETAQKNHGWDGYYNGKAGELDTYFYLLDYSCEGKRNMKKGEVMLLK